MEEADTPGSGSPLSDIDSEDLEPPKFATRSRSNSRGSTISASSEASASPTTSTPRHVDMPPAKRRKTGTATYDHATPQSASTAIPPRSPSGSVSSDTSGSVPTSPSFAHLGPTHPLSTAYAAAQANPENPDSADYIQVTRCLWDDCPNPEQGNMDNLVAHINDVHIVPRQKKYYCQWQGCGRKGQPHTSAYALKAHMRSHTKEKPFFCVLPECDRSFTRSDALAKHMRTVHETEALRPSDPVPRGHTGGISNGTAPVGGVSSGAGNGTLKRIKLIMGGGVNGEKRPSVIGELPPLPTIHTCRKMGMKVEDVDINGANESEELADAVDIDTLPFTLPIQADYYPVDIWDAMDDSERNLPPSQYFRLLRRQIHWAEQDSEELDRELRDLRASAEDAQGKISKKGPGDEKGGDDNRRFEWIETEKVLEVLIKAEANQAKVYLTGEKFDSRTMAEQSSWQVLKAVDALEISQ